MSSKRLKKNLKKNKKNKIKYRKENKKAIQLKNMLFRIKMSKAIKVQKDLNRRINQKVKKKIIKNQ